MVMVDVAVPPLAGVTEAGEKLHVAAVGSPEQVRVAAPVNPKAELTVIVAVPLLPFVMVRAEGLRATCTAGAPTVTVIAAEVEAMKLVSPPY
jgi:hypothetical protein